MTLYTYPITNGSMAVLRIWNAGTGYDDREYSLLSLSSKAAMAPTFESLPNDVRMEICRHILKKGEDGL